MMRRSTLWGLGVIAAGALAWACGLSSETSAEFAGPNDRNNPSADAAAGNASETPPGPSLKPVDNAVILVHAAKAQSYRLCFENELDKLPQPDSTVMPQANVVGVEVGGAVRLPPLKGAPGKVWLFEEPLIRALYPTFGGNKGPTCNQLLSGPSTTSFAILLEDAVTENLSTGVHLLVVKGCTRNTPLTTYSKAECGDDWDASKGNLTVKEITLTGANRATGTLPAQVVNLSQPLEAARAGRTLSVSFGDLKVAGASHTTVAIAPPLFGAAQPNEPVNLAFAPPDALVYDTTGFRVSFMTAGTDGGTPSVALEQSLVDIQRMSSPTDLPTTYFDAASNYVLLLLGDPSPKLADGGADEDERRKLHFLAVPVIQPKGDAGAGDAGPDAP